MSRIVRDTAVAAIIALLMAFTALPQTAAAQQLRGTVRDSLARPLANAEVILAVSGERVRSDSLGRFALSEASKAGDTLRVRLIGYRPYEQLLASVDSSRALVVVLRRYPQMLDTVRARVDQIAATADPSADSNVDEWRAAACFAMPDNCEPFVRSSGPT